MPHATQDISAVTALLESQLHLISDYQQHLDKIKQAIAHNDADGLNSLVEHNAALFAQLEQGLRQIVAAMPGFGFPASHDGFNDFVTRHDAPRLQQLKTELDGQLRQLQQSLLVNDLLIRKNQHRVRQCIRILSGHSSATADMTYNAQGDNRHLSDDQRMLARA